MMEFWEKNKARRLEGDGDGDGWIQWTSAGSTSWGFSICFAPRLAQSKLAGGLSTRQAFRMETKP